MPEGGDCAALRQNNIVTDPIYRMWWRRHRGRRHDSVFSERTFHAGHTAVR